jgi:hypothetical protein
MMERSAASSVAPVRLDRSKLVSVACWESLQSGVAAVRLLLASGAHAWMEDRRYAADIPGVTTGCSPDPMAAFIRDQDRDKPRS